MKQIPQQSREVTVQLIRKELQRPQTNRVLHAHPSPLQWQKGAGDIPELTRQRLSQPESANQRKLEVYLGVPFCIPTDPPHCGFCLFPTEEYKGKNSVDNYLDHLAIEAEMIRDMQPAVDINSIYIGGGTPNLLKGAHYDRLVQLIERALGTIPEGIERSIEGIPQLYNEDRIRAIKAAGFNRVSMGVQQINDELIHYSGRQQTQKQIFAAIENFQKYGLAFNVDLIFGWPEQTTQMMLRDLELLIDTGIQHITHYELNVAGISDFAIAQRANMPPRETVREMYLLGRELLLSRGFIQRTLYDWERPEPEDADAQRHRYQFEDNLRRVFEHEDGEVTTSHDMFGLGYAALGFSNGEPGTQQKNWSTGNSRSLQNYYELIRAGKLPIDRHYIRSDVDVRLSWVFQALQETRIDCASYETIFGHDLRTEASELLGLLEEIEWVEWHGQVLQVLPAHHLDVPVIQTALAAARVKEIVGDHRAQHKADQILATAVSS